MFTGLVEGTGRIESLERRSGGTRLIVNAGHIAAGLREGDSVAVNGCCLTVVLADSDRLCFDVLNETLRRTNLGDIRPSGLVNLERALAANARLGGHFVSGHIDVAAPILTWEPSGPDWVLDVAIPEGGDRYVVEKGSVAIDGISLTVAAVERGQMRIWIIPHTREVTALAERRPGDRVNLEFDILAKYVEKILACRADPPIKGG
ncbi:MAG TPA: riboflavin synthase [Verrucomicrobiae bacterium]|nr:riboflavin synthase [Verrucomicrobiae bacterium]